MYDKSLTGRKLLFLANGLSHGAFFKGEKGAAPILEALVLEDNFQNIDKLLSREAAALPEGFQSQKHLTKNKCSGHFN